MLHSIAEHRSRAMSYLLFILLFLNSNCIRDIECSEEAISLPITGRNDRQLTNFEGRFIVYDGKNKERTCQWVERLATNMRCMFKTDLNKNVIDVCPESCANIMTKSFNSIPSANSLPSLLPTTAPTDSSSTTLATRPRLDYSQLVKCKKLEDSSERFSVMGFEDKKSCDWVSRKNTKQRCKLTALGTDTFVAQFCQRTCKFRCYEEEDTVDPSNELNDSRSGNNIDESNGKTPKDKQLLYLKVIVWTIVGVLSLLVILGQILVLRKSRRKTNNNIETNQKFKETHRGKVEPSLERKNVETQDTDASDLDCDNSIFTLSFDLPNENVASNVVQYKDNTVWRKRMKQSTSKDDEINSQVDEKLHAQDLLSLPSAREVEPSLH